ncbi:hypothetical protein JKP88DRAFT_274692 [Tribonema minus]|uniref:SF3 helicase domain-containing protein n=1 Tax=Tribonema minus TaxID=303371 RepID=A0A835ZFH7_9STRA|nr:hypothetical protein JKP88DRAFT_274692 [Tribonema minus]
MADMQTMSPDPAPRLPKYVTAQMGEITGVEVVNKAALDELLADRELMHKVALGYSQKSAKDVWRCENMERLLVQYANGVTEDPDLGHVVKVTYNRREGDYGRLSALGPSFQNFIRPVRYMLASGNHCDVDIKCCHPMLMSQYLPKLGLSVPKITAYANDSKRIRATVAGDLDISVAQAKELLQKVCYDGRAALSDDAEPFKHRLVTALQKEARAAVKVIAEANPHVLKACAGRKHPDLSCASLVMQAAENACLHAIWNRATELKLQPQVPMHDGLMPLVQPTEDQLLDLADAVLKETGWAIWLELKDVPAVTVSELREEYGDVVLKRPREIEEEAEAEREAKRAREVPPDVIRDIALLMRGDVGLATIYEGLRGKDVVNAGKEGKETAEFYVFDEEECLWIPRSAEYMITREMEHIVQRVDELKDKAMLAEDAETFTRACTAVYMVDKRTRVVRDLCVRLRDKHFKDKLDHDPELLSCANGVVNLRTKEVRARCREDYLSYALPYDYDPEHPSIAKIEEFMRQITLADRAVAVRNGDYGPEWLERAADFEGYDEMPTMMNQTIGYMITGYTNKQCLFAWLGEGSNAKTALTVLMSTTFKNLYRTASVDILRAAQESAGGPQPHLLDLQHARLGVISEWDKKSVMNERNFRTLTGDQTIKARNLFDREYTEFNMTAKILLVVNNLPQLDLNFSTLRRLFAVWFPAKFVPEDPTAVEPYDPSNPTHFKQVEDFEKGLEPAAFLAYAVDGASKFLTNNFKFPPKPRCMEKFFDRIKSDNDALADFFDECVDTEDKTVEDRVLATSMWETYLMWMTVNNEKNRARDQPMKKKDFTSVMKDKGFVSIKYKGRDAEGMRDKWIYRRLRLVQGADQLKRQLPAHMQ